MGSRHMDTWQPYGVRGNSLASAQGRAFWVCVESWLYNWTWIIPLLLSVGQGLQRVSLRIKGRFSRSGEGHGGKVSAAQLKLLVWKERTSEGGSKASGMGMGGVTGRGNLGPLTL